MKRIIFFVVSLVLILNLAFTLSCSETEPGATKEVPMGKSVEYQLAVIDCGRYLDDSDERITAYKVLLDELESKTVNSRTDIGDATVKTQEVLKEEVDINRTLL